MTLTVHQERFADSVTDATVLMAMHWKELYGAAGFRADIGGMTDMEARGEFFYFTLRSDKGELAGHLGMMIIRQPLYGKLIAMDLFYYILPEHRGGTAICKLLRFGAESLQRMGIPQISMSHPADNNLGALLKRAGFRKTSEIYNFGE